MELVSSSSSSSSSSFLKSEPHFIYDVFINFGGEDIGRKLVSHLHSVLLQAQVKTLVNEENLQEGMKLDEHMGAIAVSKIAIVVFSKTYTESTCCLLELEKIIKCLETFGQVVLPVFYEIEPLDVRDQKDDFGKALEETAHRSYSGEQLKYALTKWRRALTTAAGMTSWDVRDFRDDAELVEGTEATQGLSLKLHSTSRDCFEAQAFKNMKSLRLLQLDHVQLTGDYGYLPKQLRWIFWKGFPSKYIPNNFCMENVVAMDLKHSHLQLLWKQPLSNQPQVLERLKFLNLSHSKYLRETPDFSILPSLEQLILKDCQSLCNVHPSIGDLCNLFLINLKDCTSLSCLPREVYKLKSLRTFILSSCFKIFILEKDIVQLESLITLVTENTVVESTTVKQLPCSIVSSKSIGYISLCGFEASSHNIFPSIIRSWMSPILNPQSYIRSYCMDMENNNGRDLAPLLSVLANIRIVLVQCDTEVQLSKHVKKILVKCSLNFTESRISKRHLRFSLNCVGNYNDFFNTLNNSVSEGLASSESCDVSPPGDNYPYWLVHMGEGHSVSFTVPQNSDIKRMILCVVYLSIPGIMATECLRSVLIVNYTKCTLQIHNHGSVIPLMMMIGMA